MVIQHLNDLECSDVDSHQEKSREKMRREESHSSRGSNTSRHQEWMVKDLQNNVSKLRQVSIFSRLSGPSARSNVLLNVLLNVHIHVMCAYCLLSLRSLLSHRRLLCLTFEMGFAPPSLPESAPPPAAGPALPPDCPISAPRLLFNCATTSFKLCSICK